MTPVFGTLGLAHCDLGTVAQFEAGASTRDLIEAKTLLEASTNPGAVHISRNEANAPLNFMESPGHPDPCRIADRSVNAGSLN